MSAPIEHLRVTCPAWFDITRHEAAALRGTARVEIRGASADLIVPLVIDGQNNIVLAREPVAGTVFPASCAERHINADGTFCTGHLTEHLVVSKDGARVWWGLLEDFLRLQRTAARTGRWPARRALSHGTAGDYHKAALQAATRLGIEDEYYTMLEGEPSWIGSPFPRVDRTGTRLANGRAECPLWCTDRRGRIRLRRECTRMEDVVTLIRSERSRRQAEHEFWLHRRKQGMTCCGCMVGCPLATT